MSSEKNSKLVLFNGREIRKTSHEGECWLSIIDVIALFLGGERPHEYWSDFSKNLIAKGYFEVSGKIGQLAGNASVKLNKAEI